MNLNKVNSIVLLLTVEDDILEIPGRVNSSASINYYNVSINLTRTVMQYIGPFSRVLNFYLEHSVFHDILKPTRLEPIFKGNEPTSCKNYRTISILPAL